MHAHSQVLHSSTVGACYRGAGVVMKSKVTVAETVIFSLSSLIPETVLT